MPLEIHPRLKERLGEILNETLPRVHLVHNSFLDWESFPDLSALDAAPPERDELRKKLISFIGDRPLRSFMTGLLSDELKSRKFEGEENKRPLAALPEFADIGALTSRLIAAIEALPRTYSVMVAIPHNAVQVIGPAVPNGLELTPDVRLFTVPENGGLFALAPKQEGLLLPFLGDAIPNGVTAGNLYLAIKCRGYIPIFGSSTPLEFASFLSRAFFGLCMAKILLERGRPFRMGGPHRRYLLAFAHSAEPYPFQKAYEYPIDISEAINSLTIHPLLAQARPEQRPSWALGELTQIGTVMAQHADDDRLLRAAQWLFDSYAATNPLLAFVQATTSLEILLGDKGLSDLMGLGALLANRCAFLIGRSRSQRDKIMADFNRIYDTRSKIVHRGHPRLSPTEEGDLYMLRWMCARVVQEEMKLLLADVEARMTKG